jgi:internalin A
MTQLTPEEGYQIAKQRIAQAKATGAEELDLSWLEFVELPEEIGELGDSLNTLILNANIKLRCLNGVEQLTFLTHLELANCWELNDLTPLLSLTSLETINLSLCKSLSNLTPIGCLCSLTQIDLIGCDEILDLNFLQHLSLLEKLNLSFCKRISDLTPIGYNKLLSKLNLIGCNKISTLAPLRSLTSLVELHLIGCNTIDLIHLEELTSLKVLNLSGLVNDTNCKSLEKLTSLNILNLTQCPMLKAFPGFLLDFPNLSTLYMHGSLIKDLPKELLGKYPESNCLPAIRSHFKDLDQGIKLDRELKMIVLGNGRVGKTSLCSRLIEDEFDSKEDSTHGVKFWRWGLYQDGSEEKQIDLNVWDFGGQDIYYGTHAMFHRGRAVFVICWDAETEKQEYFIDKENGFKHRNYPLQYWVDYVEHVSPGSPIIIVQSKCESDYHFAQKQVEGVEDVLQCRFCAEYEDGNKNNQNQFVSYLEQAADWVLGLPERQRIGVGRWSVKQELIKIRDEKKERTLSVKEFNQLCEQHHVSSSEELLKFLHQCGVLYHQEDLFDQEIILDQRWACDAIYTVLDRDKCFPKIQRWEGQFTQSDLNDIAWGKYQPEEQALFLKMMKDCRICFELGKDEDGKTVYLAPELVQEKERVFPRISWPEGEETLFWQYDFDFLGPDKMRRAMTEIGEKYRQSASYWQNGFYLPLNSLSAHAVVEAEYWVENDPSRGRITLQIRGKNKTGMLHLLREIFEEYSYDGKERDKGVKHLVAFNPGEYVDLCDVRKAHEDQNPNVRATNGELCEVNGYTQFLDMKRYDDPEKQKQIQFPQANSKVQTPVLSKEEKEKLNRKNVFICYAHKDDTWTDHQTPWTELVSDHLGGLVKREMIDLFCDKDLETGDKWKEVLRQKIENAGVAILMMGPCFLASKFIKDNEVPIILRKYQDEGLLLIPIYVRECGVNFIPFKIDGRDEQITLDNYQAANSPTNPLTDKRKGEIDKVLHAVTEKINKHISL